MGPLAVQIAHDLNLTASQKGMMVATPLLAGAVLRIVMGVLVDYLQPKKAGMIGPLIVMGGLTSAGLIELDTYQSVLAFGLMLGVAGASFSVALTLASRWYPPEHQGTALGITGAGNSGTAIAALIAPSLAVAFGWTNVFGWRLIPPGVCFIVYMVFAQDPPASAAPRPLADYLRILKNKDACWFILVLCRDFRRLFRPGIIAFALLQ
jgi:NNP family nitrate/nitrite transporter-like MFS transporter